MPSLPTALAAIAILAAFGILLSHRRNGSTPTPITGYGGPVPISGFMFGMCLMTLVVIGGALMLAPML